MKDVTLSWVLPLTRESGLPLDVTEISGVEISLRVVGAPDFTIIDPMVPPTQLDLVIPNLDIGDWEARAIVIDTNGIRSINNDIIGTVPDDSAPGPVTNFQFTVV
jgi:hypothetical protein